MDPNQWTFPGIITGVAILIVGGFIAYKIIRAIATFVDALQGGPHPLIEDETRNRTKTKSVVSAFRRT